MQKVSSFLVKLLACYLCASLAMIVFAMWPDYHLTEIPSALGSQLWLVPVALPMLLVVPSIEGNEGFMGSLLVFLLIFLSVAYLAFFGVGRSGKTPNPPLNPDAPPSGGSPAS